MPSNFVKGLKSLLNKPKIDRELDEELDSYQQASAQHKQSLGLTPEAAQRAAKAEIGSRSAVKHQVWTSRWESTLDSLFQDTRLSLRSLLKSPGFTAIALLSLALGIGANTAIFTLIHQVLLRNLPVTKPEQLVTLNASPGSGIAGGIDLGDFGLFPWYFVEQLASDPGPFQGIAYFGSFAVKVNIRPPGASSTAAALIAPAGTVSGNFFRVIGAQAMMGRTILPEDNARPGSGAVAVLSYHFWHESLSSDPAILGKIITINATPFAIVGVMPPGFQGLKQEIDQPELWAPVSMEAVILQQPSFLNRQGPYFLNAFARLSPQAAADKAGTGARAQSQQWLDQQIRNGIRANSGATIAPDREQEIVRHTVPIIDASQGISGIRNLYGSSLRILLSITGLVLLIACANLANFLLTRAATRQRETATRLALGSSRFRLIRQALIEAMLLSLSGAVLGLGLAFAATRALIAFVVGGYNYTNLDPTPNLTVLLFTLGVSLVTALLFGLLPAVSAARTSASTTLTSNARTAQGSGGRSARFWPKALVTAQVMVALLLLVAAGLFLRTLRNLQNQDYGFERDHLLLAEFNAKLAGYAPHQAPALHHQILERLGNLPSVRSAAISLTAPISYGNWSSSITVPGRVNAPHENRNGILNRVSGQYFETAGIALVAGRPLADTDTATSLKVAVVNQALARQFFPDGNALGHSVKIDIDNIAGPWQIVGVARDTRSSDPRTAAARPMVYLPLDQIPLTEQGPDGLRESQDAYGHLILLRTSADPGKSIADLRAAMNQVDPNLPLSEIHPMREYLDEFMSQQQLISSLTIIFSGLALLLAAIGLYGVMSYNVVRRTNEIGIRLALGAQTHSVLWMVLNESLLLLALGLALGFPLTLAATKLTSSFLAEQLYGIKALDPLTFAAAILVVSAMTVLAAWLPARSAAKVNPMQALRCD